MNGRPHAAAFLALLHPNPSPAQLVQFVALAKNKPPESLWHWDPACGALDEALEFNTLGRAVYVGVNPRASMAGGERGNIPHVHALPIDVDTGKTGVAWEAVAARLEGFGLPPSIQVVSGNGGHLYLLLDAPAPLDAAEATGRRLMRELGTDSVWNASRIMRLPGTVNWKEPPTLCYLHAMTGQRFALEAIDAALDRAGVPQDVAPPVRQRLSFRPAPASLETAVAMLPPEIHGVVTTGRLPAHWTLPSASEADWRVCCALLEAGATREQIEGIYAAYPVRGLKAAAAGPGYLERTINRATAEVAAQIEARAAAAALPCPPFEDVGHGVMAIRQPPESLREYALRVRARSMPRGLN